MIPRSLRRGALLASALIASPGAFAQSLVGGTVLDGTVPAYNINATGPFTLDRTTLGLRVFVVNPSAGNGGSGASPSVPTYTAPAGVTRTSSVCTLPAYASGGSIVCVDKATGQQTTTAVSANTAGQILPANANRKTFFIQNRTSGVTVDYGYNASVSPGTGIGADGTQVANGQGAGFVETPAHVGSYFATASSAATVIVVQGQ